VTVILCNLAFVSIDLACLNNVEQAIIGDLQLQDKIVLTSPLDCLEQFKGRISVREAPIVF
jgi:hypothetical protein